MFVLQLSPTYYQPVNLRVPLDAGKSSTVTFDVELKRLSQSEHEALMKRAKADQLTDAEVARQLVAGWRGVRGTDNTELTFTPESFERLLQVPGAGTAICAAYLASIDQAPGKN